MRIHPLRPHLVVVLGCLLTILLFFLDIAVSQADLWGSYLLPIALVFLWGRRRDIYIVTALASVLLLGAYWTEPTLVPGAFQVNYLLPLALLWGVAWLLAQHRQMQKQIVDHEQELDERVKARTVRLAANEEQLAKIFGVNPAAIAITRQSDGCYLDANPAYLRLLGYTRDELVGHRGVELGILSAPARSQIIGRVSGQAAAVPFEVQLHTKAGPTIDVMTAVDTIDFAGEPCYLSFMVDLTERKRLEEAGARLAAIVNSSFDAIVSTDLQGRVVSWNPNAEQLYECSASKAIGRPINELLPPDQDSDEGEILARVRRGEQVPLGDRVWTKADGTTVDLSIILSPVNDTRGALIGVASIARDITARKQLEAALAASEQKWRSVFEFLPVGLSVVDGKDKVTDSNPALAQILGMTPEGILACRYTHRRYFHADMRPMLPEDFPSQRALREGQVVRDVVIGVEKEDGELIWVSVSATPESIDGLALTATVDITARKRAETERLLLAERWKMAAHVSSIGVWDWLAGNDEVMWDERMYQLHGLAPGTAMNFALWRILIHPDDRAAVEANNRKSGLERTWTPVEYRVVLQDGSLRHLLAIGGGLYDEGGTPVRQLGISMDITERKHMEEALVASERKYRELYDNSPDIYLSGYSNGTFRDCNLTAVHKLGYTREELMNRPTSTIFTPASYSRVIAELPKHLAAEAWDNFEVQLQCKDGTVLDALLSAQFEPATADHLAYSRVALHDITERKRAEQALRESQARYQMLADHVTDVIWSMDPACKVTYVSPSTLRQSGFTPEETIGLTLEQTIAPGSRAAARTTIGEIYRLIQAGQPVPATPNVFEMLRKDGTTYWGENIYSVVYNAQGEFQQLVGATREVTRRVNAEAQLREAYQRVQLAADAAGIGIWNWNFADDILEWDDRMCELYGVPLSAREQGLYYDIWRSHLHPDDRDAAESTFLAAINDGSPVRIHYRIVLPDGTLRYIQAASIIDYSYSGAPQRMIGINRDITDQTNYQRLLQDTNAVLEEHVAARTAELRTALTELQRADRLKDEFMAMISHELRTPLAGVLTISELLADQIAGPLNGRQLNYVQGITQSGERLLAVINGILGYTHLLAGKVQFHAERCELAHLLDICATSQQHKAAAKNQVITVQVQPPDLVISADATALAEVLKRLLDNAVKFTPAGGQIGLEAHPGGAPGTVDLVVWDTGIGIAADQLDNVFHAFIQADARLSRSHEGIGIGLAYTDEVVRLMGGTISLASTPGTGSRFTITLSTR